MSWFARIEQACAAFIEQAFAKTFPSDLEPAQIARKLVATMEARTRGVESRLVAPGRYAVIVNDLDYERLAPHRAYLEREWAGLLTDMAARVNVVFPEVAVTVGLRRRADIPKGAIEIEASALDSTERVDLPQHIPATTRYQLRMVRGVPAYGVYPVEGTLQVGRSDESGIFLVDPSVSRKHATIEMDGGVPVVRDLGSTNGTFLNGERVTTHELAAGDLVAFGKTELRVEVVSA